MTCVRTGIGQYLLHITIVGVMTNDVFASESLTMYSIS